MNAKRLVLSTGCDDHRAARIGGPALIGGLADWPTAPDGNPLALVMSLPTRFLNEHAGFALPADCVVSVFSYYSRNAYFLDLITYHGSREELDVIREGHTRVLLHAQGAPQTGPTTLPALAIAVEAGADGDAMQGDLAQATTIGGDAGLLQAEPLALDGQRFALQVYGNVFPRPYEDMLYLTVAIGYLYMDERAAPSPGRDAGTFFVQVT
jgi:hypothetical protein